jgi:hypothetical protein
MGTVITALDCRLKKEGRERAEARAEEMKVARCGRGKGRGEREERDGLTAGSTRQRAREEEAGVRAGREADGPIGPKGKVVSFFSFFLFQTFFNTILFQIKSKPKSFKLFTKFYKSFRLHASNQKLCKAKY